MSLSTFIKKNEEAILKDWEEFAQTNINAAKSMSSIELRDHLGSILNFITNDLDSYQTASDQKEKSEGNGPKAGGTDDSAAETHADLRFIEGFDALDLMSEFRALRASVVRLWEGERSLTESDYQDMVRFNEAVDQVSSEGFSRHTEKVNHARHLFLASLVHDLRNPLGTVSLAAQMLKAMTNLDEKQKNLTEQIFISTTRTVELVSDLIDVRARLGKGMPVSIHPMDLGVTVDLAVAEIQIAYPDQKISIWAEGDLKGEWDSIRIGQLLSNLIGNAIQHGETRRLIEVVAKGEEDEVMLSVHNYGIPIPPAAIPHIFEAMVQGRADNRSPSAPGSLGLGLFIAREIVLAHGGEIDVISTADAGTTFTARLPRKRG
jgi:signal transduction histidine kinase